MNIMKFQLGKAGITPGIIESLKLGFKHHKIIRISVLRSLAPNRESIQELADQIVTQLGGTIETRIIGFTIILRRRGTTRAA